MNRILLVVLAAVLAVSGWALLEARGAGTAGAAQEDAARVYELRTYHLHPGKLEALHARFRDHTDRLFKRHGIEPVGYWVTLDDEAGEEKLVFLLAHPSREAAAQAWQAFREDPEWVEAKAASEVDGLLVERADVVFMQAADYSPLK